MSTIDTTSPSLLNIMNSIYGATSSNSTPSMAEAMAENDPLTSPSSMDDQSATMVTLSAAAQAYLAANQTPTPTPAATTTSAPADASLASVSTAARSWFDQQYATLGISSAMIDGQTAVDFSSQSRATLSAVASNTQGLFSSDESTAAGDALQSRFDDAMAPHVVVAQNKDDYESLYQAASDYLNQAGTDEQATTTWKNQMTAVTAGLNAATADPATAPDTGDVNDPIEALLNDPTSDDPTDPNASTSTVIAHAHSMLDAQTAAAKAAGTTLQFDPSDSSGQQVDFTNFDNRTLATMVLNTDSSFSSDETRAANNELNSRTRTAMASALGSGDGPSDVLGMLQVYGSMSDEEKSVLGVTDDVQNKLIANYNSMLSLQNALSGLTMDSMGGSSSSTNVDGFSMMV